MNNQNSFLRTLGFVLLMGGVAVANTGCSQADKQEISAESDQAYNDMTTFVNDVEAKTDAVGDEMKADYERETAQLKADYQTKKAAVDKYADQYDDNRRQEIDRLNTRYTTAVEQRTTAWNNRTTVGELGQYYKPMSPAAQLTAANARTTYEKFVQNVKSNQEKYDINDWRNINAEWRALDEAYDNVKGSIPAKDLAEIQKEKLKYAAFKSWDKTKIRAGQGADAVANKADDVSNETADERSRAGQAISNTASDVKEAGKDVGQGAAKVGKKVGGAVKDVFDGKDDDKK
ncbi:hypothetical protein MUN81_09355 [Hymenobacter sp. 5317J-9]|uniref:DUF6565 domain-containing protein n=1 Tax=Hymenobacter sp. 5317J-9 TaxID=2932250 RepID=UPI001FD6ABF9|nr:DUF6565 domain-containing protein [Hymenobacter sp. 5317J-9]UOQ99685.1 hypothetical protein MUN81_09355 [Hymenobacter sp. 5317J-9]